MRAIAAVVLLSATTLAVAQQEKPDENALARIRVEYAVSGLGKITPQQTAMANVGAGPHTVRHTEAAKREPVPEEDVKSKDAGSAPHRP
jgi:hypothetical protein